MTTRTAKVISRALILVTMIGFLASLAVARSAYPKQTPGQIAVVGNPDQGDGPATLTDLRHRRSAEGVTFVQDAPILIVIVLVGVSLTWLVTGSLIVSRQPRNTSGWIFLAIGAALSLAQIPQALVIQGAKVDPGSVPLLDVWAALGEYAVLVVALVPLLFLLYPDGRPPSQRWRIAEHALFGGLATAALGSLVAPGPLNNYVDSGVIYMNPLGVPSLAVVAPVAIALGTIVTLVAGLSSLLAVRGRFKRSTGDERQQLRWLVSVATLVGVLLLFSIALGIADAFVDTSVPVEPVMFALMALTIAFGVPASYLIAIYRYHLYDLDVVVKKAVVFAVMVGAVMALYLLIAVIPLAVMGFGSGLQAGAVLLGVVIGLLVFPVRSRAKRFADRIVYGKRATPYEVLTAFSGRVGETYATDDVLPRMAQILAEGVGASAARVWLLLGGTLRPEAAWPVDAHAIAGIPMRGDELPVIPGEDAVPVRHRGEILGALSVTMPVSDPMTPAKERLVDDLAEQAGLVLKNVRLIDDLRSSRQRLVAAQDEERRRIERNIHDGAQQQIVALTVQLKLLQAMIERDPAKAIDLAGSLQAASTTALEDLRDLARGIYPPLLADKGLVVALEGQARKAALPVTVTAEEVARYSPDVEATAYFCVLEALNNVVKYANASVATLALIQTDGHLEFVVTDDGDGFDANDTAYGTGLQGMRDRLDASGGTLTVESSPGAGTTVRGRLPV